MGKHTKKRPRTTKDDAGLITPLGSVPTLNDEDSKDEEEKRLEALLFGTTFSSTQIGLSQTEDEENDANIHAGEGLSNLPDSDLFFFDDATPAVLPENLAIPPPRELSEHIDDEITDTLPNKNLEGLSKATDLTTSNSRRKKKAAWADLDDQNLKVSLASDKRLRKLRDAPLEDEIGGKEYEARLRRQYEKVHPVPEWASAARDRLHKRKRRRSSQSTHSEEAGSDAEERIATLLSTSGGLLSSRPQKYLPQGHLSIERLRDANQSAKGEGEIRSVMFHPSPSVPVLLTASSDRRLRLFNIDGHTNPHLQSVHLPSLPIASAIFHPTGSSVLLTGHRPFYYTYDLQSGACTRSPRGLWGSFAANPDGVDLSMEICAFSHSGQFLAVAGRRGYVHIVDWYSGGGQVVGSVKMNAGVKDLWWTKDGNLMTLAGDTEVYLWDVGERRCMRRWKDHGGFGSVKMVGARGGEYLAIGSETGLVNVYGSECATASVSNAPKPLKTISNLTTSTSTMRFNHDAQILALASRSKKDQLKLVHLPSLTVFSNWPASTTPLGHITSMDFSQSSEYAAIGNNRGRVLLYNLRHFGTV